ncbi:hypothetical protein HPB49_003633 [Dermacentor silvarum]|uniref:Uncharacterized protein n=1 Tax=Dermacentor silvarum TaxID=543639 RepID=A0ACB8CPI6_DERSI|nr:hypothetical protein HPB49_003633 [Dermacentor silvarum]
MQQSPPSSSNARSLPELTPVHRASRCTGAMDWLRGHGLAPEFEPLPERTTSAGMDATSAATSTNPATATPVPPHYTLQKPRVPSPFHSDLLEDVADFVAEFSGWADEAKRQRGSAPLATRTLTASFRSRPYLAEVFPSFGKPKRKRNDNAGPINEFDEPKQKQNDNGGPSRRLGLGVPSEKENGGPILGFDRLTWSRNDNGARIPRTARCVVPICHSRSAPSSILYPLPAELSQRQAWIDFVRGCPCGGARDWNPPSNEISLVCSLHFSVRCFRFQRPRGYSVGYSKCLRRDAVPTLYPIEEQCSSVPNENFPDDTAERLVSSGVEDAAGRTPNSLASSRSVAGQDRGHCASDQDTARRLAHLAAFELTFLKNVSTQCSVEMASKAASCAVRTVSKSVQCSG